MADIKLYWKGASGREYSFFVHPVGTAYKAIGGVYLFCTYENGIYSAVYVGETHDLNQRLNTSLQNHHAWPRGRLLGVTYFGTMAVPGGNQARINIETDLRQGINPSLNRQ